MAVLGVVLVAGQALINVLPPAIVASFNFALPGILGAMLVMMGSKIKVPNLIPLLAIGTAAMVIVRFLPKFLPANIATPISLADTGLIAVLGILYSVLTAKKDHAKQTATQA